MIIKIYFCIISSSKNNYIFVPLQQEKKHMTETTVYR